MVPSNGAVGAAVAPLPAHSFDFRQLLLDLCRIDHVRGSLAVTPEGLVIDAVLSGEMAVQPISARAASLGRELELQGPRGRRGALLMAHVASDDGTVFLGGTPVGFIVVLGGAEVNRDRVRLALRTAMETVRDRLGPLSERRR
ncbi:MAG: hypothetical protein ACREJ9_18060 [Candidatus Rokuibacteriota bacterium]